jgi:hypothetical protein
MVRKTGTSGRLSRRNMTWVWILSVSAIIAGLIYWEQTALLYVLATFGVSALLIVVALADLSGSRQVASAPASGIDAATGSVIKPTPQSNPPTTSSRSVKRGSS